MEKLQVPENITLRWEAWRGVGKPELTIIALITSLAILSAILFCLLSPLATDKLIAVFGVSMVFTVSYGLFGKLDNNQSIYDFFRYRRRFKQEQQIFLFKKKTREVYLIEKKATE